MKKTPANGHPHTSHGHFLTGTETLPPANKRPRTLNESHNSRCRTPHTRYGAYNSRYGSLRTRYGAYNSWYGTLRTRYEDQHSPARKTAKAVMAKGSPDSLGKKAGASLTDISSIIDLDTSTVSRRNDAGPAKGRSE